MNIETIGLAGFAFAATSIGALMRERRMDVLYGPYIEGRNARPAAIRTRPAWKPAHSFADQLRWKARHMIYLASIVAC